MFSLIRSYLSQLFTRRSHGSVYEHLENHFSTIRGLMDTRESLIRDELIHTKDGAVADKDNQIRVQSQLIQEKLRDPELKRTLRRAEQQMLKGRYDGVRQQHIQQMLFMQRRETALSVDDAAEAGRIEAENRKFHSRVKSEDNWEAARDELEKVVNFKRVQAQKLQRKFNCSTAYEALLQGYCPGSRERDLAQHFEKLVPELKQIKSDAVAAQAQKPEEIDGVFDPDTQMRFLRDLIAHTGFDRDRGDLYATEHDPIEGGTRNDARVVIKTPAEDGASFRKAIKSALHEGTHGLHLQNLPEEDQYSLLGMPPGTDLWEAMALGYEMVLGRTREFSHFIADKANEYFGQGAVNGEQMYRLRTHVEPGLDRKTADEVSYHLHIAIRFDLEKRLINGELEVDAVPDEWNRLYEDYFGMRPETPAEGVLQDVHWWVGKFGYFPSYSLGLMEFAQLNEAQAQANPHYRDDLATGDFTSITGWYTKNVFAQGRYYEPGELVQHATGKPLGPEALLNHLRERYFHVRQQPAPSVAHSAEPR